MSQSADQMTVEGRPISLQPLTATCDSLKLAIACAYGELDQSIGLGSAILTEDSRLQAALVASQNTESLQSRAHRIRKRTLEAQRRFINEASQLTLKDTIVMDALSKMGYIDESREAFFPNCAIYMTYPGPRKSSAPSSNREASRRSFNLLFTHSHMAAAARGSTGSTKPDDDVSGEALKAAMIEMNFSNATAGVWEYAGYSVHEVSDVPAAIRSKEWVLWQDMEDPVEDDEEVSD